MIKSVKIKFDKMKAETLNAFLLKIDGDEFWFPKRFCKNFILNKKLGGNTVIPTWLYIDKFKQTPNECDADEIIEKHTPKKLNPLENNTIKRLKKNE